MTLSFFDPTRTKPLEIFPGYQDLVKDINPANAAILAVYSDIGPQYILGELSTRTVGLN
jgi:hypothetical protein